MSGFSNLNNGHNLLPIFPVIEGQEENLKLTEDEYEVYVNGEYLGNKSIKTEAEQLSDIDDFLKAQGFDSFSSSLEGNQYTIETNESKKDIQTAVSVYLNNR